MSIYFKDGQIWRQNQEAEYLYDYYYDETFGYLWIKVENTADSTLHDTPNEFSNVYLFFKNGEKPGVSLNEPAAGGVVEEISQESGEELFKWSRYPEAENYNLLISSDPDFEQIEYSYQNLESTAYMFGSEEDEVLINKINYYWKVKADNSDWSETWTFFTDFILNLDKPASNDSTALAKPTFSWFQFYSGDEAAESYTIQIGSDEELNNILLEETVNDTSFVPENTYFEENVSYYWKVKADISKWSETRKFLPFSRPTQTSPGTNQNNNTEVDSENAVLSWEPINSATWFKIKIAEDSLYTGESLVWESDNIDGGLSEFAVPSGILEPDKDGGYYWMIDSDATTQPSYSAHFYTNTKVILPEPENESENVGLTVLLRWDKFTDSNETIVEVSTDEDFNNIVHADTMSYAGSSSMIDENLDSDTWYYWHVKTDMTDGWSDTWSFKTVGTVNLLYPENGASDASLISHFKWEPFYGTDEYVVELADENENTIETVTVTDTMVFMDPILDNNTTYKWRVKSDNSPDYWSDYYTFTTLQGNASKSILVAPDINASDQALVPNFEWVSEADTTFYRLIVSSDVDFDNIVLDKFIYEDLNDDEITDSAYEIDFTLEFGSTYYWKVCSESKNFSEVFNFETDSGVPQDLEVYVNSYNKADIYWSDTSTNEDGFIIERAENNGDWEEVKTVGEDTKEVSDFQLDDNKTYKYRLRAYKNDQYSEYSNESEFITPLKLDVDSLMEDLNFVEVPAGSFTMGNSNGDPDEQNEHEVNLTHDYSLGKFEITNQQFVEVLNWALGQAKIKIGSSYFSDNPIDIEDIIKIYDEQCHIEFDEQARMFISNDSLAVENRPAVQATWKGAAYFCNWLSEISGKNPLYDTTSWEAELYGNTGYRLPTEAEWEYAARYDDSRLYPWGDAEPTENHANYDNNVGNETDVGTYTDGNSQLGFADMAGNAWEWCNDYYEMDYPEGPIENPAGPDGNMFSGNKVIRGGAWTHPAHYLRTTNRAYCPPDISNSRVNDAIGLRILLIQ